MKSKRNAFVILIVLVVAGVAAPAVMAQEPQTKGPTPDVPEIYTLEGEFVRIAYNNEGWITLGYRTANNSQGDEWMLLEAGVTIRKPSPDQKLTRTDFSLKMPDGSMVPMASRKEYVGAGYLRALNRRAGVVRDSINYFPVDAHQACPMQFFSDPAQGLGTLMWDEFEITSQRACLGRLFFKMPEGQKIDPGQYWLSIKFAGSTVEAPFRIMTKEEEKFFSKNWKDLKKEHEAFLKSEAEKAKKRQ